MKPKLEQSEVTTAESLPHDPVVTYMKPSEAFENYETSTFKEVVTPANEDINKALDKYEHALDKLEATPTNEWREELIKNTVNTVARMNEAMYVSKDARTADIRRTISGAMQEAIATHSAHLVERLEASKTANWKSALSGSEEIAVKSYNAGLDQAIDIVKDNK